MRWGRRVLLEAVTRVAARTVGRASGRASGRVAGKTATTLASFNDCSFLCPAVAVFFHQLCWRGSNQTESACRAILVFASCVGLSCRLPGLSLLLSSRIERLDENSKAGSCV